MAASELFAVTSDSVYLEAARIRSGNLEARLHERGYFVSDDGERPNFHAAEAGLPVIALVRFSEVETDDEWRVRALSVVEKHLAYLVRVSSETENPYGYGRQHFRSSERIRSGFFIPHDNETGYWWQGESARLGSLAAAAILGGRALSEQDCGLGVGPELVTYATDQLDWILGKNPLDVSMMAGHGRNNPPEYCSVKVEHHGHHTGGISNGITGSGIDGAGLQWRAQGATGDSCWEDWRWIEQWLPHSTWYLFAVTAIAQDP